MTTAAKSPTKTRVLQLRVTEQELSALTALAKSRGVSASEYHRRLLRVASHYGVDMFPDEVSALQDLRRDVRAIGKNVNQLTKAINSEKLKPADADYESITTATAVVRSVAKKLADLAEDARSRRIRVRKAAKR